MTGAWANPHTNSGTLLRDLRMPDARDHAMHVPFPGAVSLGDTPILGLFLRNVIARNIEQRNFCPAGVACRRWMKAR